MYTAEKNATLATAAVSTKALHADTHLAATAEVAPAISVSSTFDYNKAGATVANFPGQQLHVYARMTTPTRSRVEAVLDSVLEGHSATYSTGLASAFALLVQVRPRRVAIRHGYHGTHAVLAEYAKLQPCGAFSIVDLAAPLQEGDLVWLESPVNPTGELHDIRYYADKCHAVGAKLVVDATLAPPPLMYPFRHGADFVMHSSTKYLSGHSDALGGVLAARCPSTAEKLRETRSVLGAVMGSLEAWLLLRSLRTLDVRVREQSRTARMLVAWLHQAARGCGAADGLPAGVIKAVHHASLQAFAPTHDVCAQMPGGFGAVFSITMASSAAAQGLANTLKLARNATSIGGVESLVEWRHASDPAIDPCLVRVSVGLENIDDIKADWRQALQALAAQTAKAPACPAPVGHHTCTHKM